MTKNHQEAPKVVSRHFDDAGEAYDHVLKLYNGQVEHLRQSLQRFVAGDVFEGPVRAKYPFVRIHTDTVARADSRLAYGFVAGPGTYETTLTRPDLFADYYREQFSLLLRNHGVSLEIGLSRDPIPVHFSLADNDHVEGNLTPDRRLLLRDLFDLPDLAAMDDGIANGTYEVRGGAPRPLALFTAPRVDYSLHRLRHYTGTSPEHFQNFVLFTNYQFYIDQFVQMGREIMARVPDPKNPRDDDDYIAFVEPGNVITRRVGLTVEPGDTQGTPPPRLPQMPGYHLVRRDHSGITMVWPGSCWATAPACATHSSWVTTCWPTAMCVKTMCWTKTCPCGCRSRRWLRCN
jgi:AMP nucleosidase